MNAVGAVASSDVARSREPLVDLRGRPLDVAPISPLLEALDVALHPIQVWLFGSRARGEARASSDWDVLVVVPDDVGDDRLDACTGRDIARGVGIRADVVLCRASDFRDLSQTCNTIEYEVAHSGVVLHAAVAAFDVDLAANPPVAKRPAPARGP